MDTTAKKRFRKEIKDFKEQPHLKKALESETQRIIKKKLYKRLREKK